MNNLIFLLAFSFTSCFAPPNSQVPLRRADSFFGLHFDFHATPKDNKIGTNIDQAAIKQFLKDIDPDFIQVDAKGHGGIASYPSKVGPHPPLAVDLLQMYRKLTTELGIALYAHYSGIIDTDALEKHPVWGRLDQSGERDKSNVSIYSPYVLTKLIPQLKELCDYNLDGVFMDGDVWSLYTDYNDSSLNQYYSKSRFKSKPVYGSNANYNNYVLFQENQYLNYLRKYIDAMHAYKPKFQIGVNWAFTSIMPDPSNIQTDFLSADMPEDKSLDDIALQSRILAYYNKPWDIMLWGFDKKNIKPLADIAIEISTVITQGGGVEVYYVQNRNGELPLQHQATIKQIAQFVRPFQAPLFKSHPVREVAILYPVQSVSALKSIPFKDIPKVLSTARAYLKACLDVQYQTDVIPETASLQTYMKYKALLLPAWELMTAQTKTALQRYLDAGGNIIASGRAASSLRHRRLKLAMNPADVPRHLQNIYTGKLVELVGNVPDGTRCILAQKNGRQLLSIFSVNKLSPSTKVNLAVRLAKRPKQIKDMKGKTVDFQYEFNKVKISLPVTGAHQVLVIN